MVLDKRVVMNLGMWGQIPKQKFYFKISRPSYFYTITIALAHFPTHTLD